MRLAWVLYGSLLLLPRYVFVLLPAGPCSLEVHADPEELKYWREVEEEQLITDSGDDSSSDAGLVEQQQEEQEQ